MKTAKKKMSKVIGIGYINTFSPFSYVNSHHAESVGDPEEATTVT